MADGERFHFTFLSTLGPIYLACWLAALAEISCCPLHFGSCGYHFEHKIGVAPLGLVSDVVTARLRPRPPGVWLLAPSRRTPRRSLGGDARRPRMVRFPCCLLVCLGLRCFLLLSVGLVSARFPLQSVGFSCYPLVSLGIRWFALLSIGFPWYPLVPLGSRWFPLVSAWFPLLSIGFPWYPLVPLGVGVFWYSLVFVGIC